MSLSLRVGCPALEDIRSVLSEPTSFHLPEDLDDQAKSDALTFTADSAFGRELETYNPITRVALLLAASNSLAAPEKGPVISLSLTNLLNILPPGKPPPSSGSFAATVFDISAGLTVTDDSFTTLLLTVLDGLHLTAGDQAILRRPYVSAAVVLSSAALCERLWDYAILLLGALGELQGAEALPTTPYTRENAPLYLSLSAQRLSDSVMDSKLMKKKGGSDFLTKIPPAFAPLLGSIAAVRTGIAKYTHLYEPIGLEHHLLNLSSGVSYIVRLLGPARADVDRAALPLLLAEAVSALYNATFSEQLDRRQAAIPAGRQLPFGLVTKVFLAFVKAEGIIGLTKLPVFVAPEGKRGSIPQCPTGCRDLKPLDMRLREQVLGVMTAIFKRHGAVQIETPVFEAREVLTAKYGEEGKLIYNLEDQGGELLSLRYDLTVPFARYVATHGVSAIKRYQIAKVYRRDKPQPEQGRYREFYQFDFDIAGPSGPMIADAEVIQIMAELLTAVGKGLDLNFVIELSDRRLLAILTAVAGVAPEKFRVVCSSIDKLDKRPWPEVRSELIDVKGLRPESADKLYEYIQLNGDPYSVLGTVRDRLQADCPSTYVKEIQPILDELAVLFDYLRAFRVLDSVRFNLSLARGLDYYTGVIFEAVGTGGVRVGSLGGGGRYDELIGQFANRKVPSVGMSIGIERLFTVIEQGMTEKPREVDIDVFVCSVAQNYTKERMELLADLWANGISAEFVYKEKPNVKDQFGQASATGAKLAVTIGPDEVAAGTLRVKVFVKKQEILAEREEFVIERANLIATVKRLLAERE